MNKMWSRMPRLMVLKKMNKMPIQKLIVCGKESLKETFDLHLQ